ncbi:9610_t:CDS:2 [Rhizophagus irregularis]|nr:9610_t:CDS:2 [Rhizophagus irregularis]
MTEIKVYTYGKRMKYNLEQYLNVLWEKYFFCTGRRKKGILADICSNRRESVLMAVLFSIKLGSKILKKILEEILRENFSEGTAQKEPIEEKKLSLEKDVEDKTRLIKLKEEEINELKEKIKEMEVTAKE